MPNNTLTKVTNQFEQMVIASQQWRQTLAESPRERALLDDEFKIHFDAQICKIAVRQFGSFAVEGWLHAHARLETRL